MTETQAIEYYERLRKHRDGTDSLFGQIFPFGCILMNENPFSSNYEYNKAIDARRKEFATSLREWADAIERKQ